MIDNRLWNIRSTEIYTQRAGDAGMYLWITTKVSTQIQTWIRSKGCSGWSQNCL